MNKVFRKKLIKELKSSLGVDVEKVDAFFSERGGRKDLLRSLLREEVVSEQTLVSAMVRVLDVPPVDLEKVSVNKQLIELIPEKILKKHRVFPLSRIGKSLTVAMFDATDIMVLDDIKSVTGCNIAPVLASHSQLEKAISDLFDTAEKEFSSIITEGEQDLEMISSEEEIDVVEITKESTAAPIVKMVDLIVSEAIKRGASDIHIEPQERSLRVRYRVDGALREAFDLPKKNQNAVIARIKIMSKLDITETRVPQDGRFRIRMGDKEIDFRVSSLPINFGNKIVLRALDKGNLSIGLDALGFLPQPLADFQEALRRPYGIILVTGPTGSGKSTTLYSILNEMNTPDRNIVTVENPVEYQVEGITQIAAKPEIGMDFASGLKAILRQSPDVIMVGEIRDFETADIAIKASLTGQMVLSTLHTNDSVGAITRLENMGIEPFLVASSLVMACAQRLMRRICPNCKEPANVPDQIIAEIKEKYPEAEGVDVFYTGKGCEKCDDTGYKGRAGTLETLLVDDNLRAMVNKQKSEAEIREYLKSKNIRTLRDNAMIKFIKGITSLEEVYRVT